MCRFCFFLLESTPMLSCLYLTVEKVKATNEVCLLCGSHWVLVSKKLDQLVLLVLKIGEAGEFRFCQSLTFYLKMVFFSIIIIVLDFHSGSWFAHFPPPTSCCLGSQRSAGARPSISKGAGGVPLSCPSQSQTHRHKLHKLIRERTQVKFNLNAYKHTHLQMDSVSIPTQNSKLDNPVCLNSCF